MCSFKRHTRIPLGSGLSNDRSIDEEAAEIVTEKLSDHFIQYHRARNLLASLCLIDWRSDRRMNHSLCRNTMNAMRASPIN